MDKCIAQLAIFGGWKVQGAYMSSQSANQKGVSIKAKKLTPKAKRT
jgi:hypothetical protein